MFPRGLEEKHSVAYHRCVQKIFSTSMEAFGIESY